MNQPTGSTAFIIENSALRTEIERLRAAREMMQMDAEKYRDEAKKLHAEVERLHQAWSADHDAWVNDNDRLRALLRRHHLRGAYWDNELAEETRTALEVTP